MLVRMTFWEMLSLDVCRVIQGEVVLMLSLGVFGVKQYEVCVVRFFWGVRETW